MEVTYNDIYQNYFLKRKLCPCLISTSTIPLSVLEKICSSQRTLHIFSPLVIVA